MCVCVEPVCSPGVDERSLFPSDSGNSSQFEGEETSVSQWDFGAHSFSAVVQRQKVCREKHGSCVR